MPKILLRWLAWPGSLNLRAADQNKRFCYWSRACIKEGLTALVAIVTVFSARPGWAQASGAALQPETKAVTDAGITIQARRLFERGDLVAAIEQWSMLLIRQPADQAALFNRAQAYLLLGQPGLALADLDALRLARRGRLLSEASVLRGVALAALGQRDLAMQSFDQAWAQGKSLMALANKAMLLKAMGRTGEAQMLASQLVLLEPSIANYYSLALLQKENRDYGACLQTAGTILQSNPSHASSYALRGLCAFHLNQDKRALADLLRSHALAPNVPETMLDLGKILMRLGKWDEGLPWILRAASLYLQQGKGAEHQRALAVAKQTR
jgi:tetratricopeptide (TPR) repeat protein